MYADQVETKEKQKLPEIKINYNIHVQEKFMLCGRGHQQTVEITQ